MPDSGVSRPWIAKSGREEQIGYRVRLTESGMHIEIGAEAENGTHLGNVWISRFDWALVQGMVEQAFRQEALLAQAENIATDALFGDED